MKKYNSLLCLLWCVVLSAQPDYRTDRGNITFNASTPLENIVAENPFVNAIYVSGSGVLGIVLLMEDFEFPRALMQEHFNENYAESHRFPKAIFKGTLRPTPSLDTLVADKTYAYEGQVEGTLTLHGVTRMISAPVAIRKNNERLFLESGFRIRPEAYDIQVPKLLFNKIAEEVRVEVSLDLTAESP